MSNRFDTALINREKNRQVLAEVLEANYAAERRNALIKRISVVGAVLGVAAWGLGNGFSGASDIAAITQTQKKLQDRKKIFSEIEKQMENGDQMMIGSDQSASPPTVQMTGDDDEDLRNLAKSTGDADSYGNEKVPLNLAGEVRQKMSRQQVSQQGKNGLDLGSAGVSRPKHLEREIESLPEKRHAATSAADYGKYQQGNSAERANDPLLARKQRHAIAPGLYERVYAPPRRLARELRHLENSK